MKRVLALLTVFAMVFVLFACKEEPDGSSFAADAFAESIDLSDPSVPEGEQSYKDTEFSAITSPQDYFETQIFTEADTDIYYLFHEPIRDTGKAYPLVIFLHGLGDTVNERSLGTATQFVDSLIWLENESEEYSAYTLVPSTPLAHEGGWSYAQLEAFKRLIYHLLENFNIDSKRLYVSGISMGGFTTCQLVNEMPPDTFAAAAPLSGARMMTHPERLHNTAFHIYHSTNDTVVDVSSSRWLNEQLLISGHPKVEYTEFENGDHISPLYSVYTNQCYQFFGWMFAQRLP